MKRSDKQSQNIQSQMNEWDLIKFLQNFSVDSANQTNALKDLARVYGEVADFIHNLCTREHLDTLKADLWLQYEKVSTAIAKIADECENRCTNVNNAINAHDEDTTNRVDQWVQNVISKMDELGSSFGDVTSTVKAFYTLTEQLEKRMAENNKALLELEKMDRTHKQDMESKTQAQKQDIDKIKKTMWIKIAVGAVSGGGFLILLIELIMKKI